jgi:flagellin FlaB
LGVEKTNIPSLEENVRRQTKKMMRKLMKIIHRQQKGITGLETAIILIAFVVVAAVFAYTVLSAGLFSTQKSQEAVYSGLQEAQGSLEMRGDVVAYHDTVTASGTTTDYGVGSVQFMVSLSSDSADPIDLTPSYIFNSSHALVANLSSGKAQNVTQIAFNDSDVTIPDCAWTLDWVGANNSNNLLDPNEKALITVYFHPCTNTSGVIAWTADDGSDANLLGSNTVSTYKTFTLEVKPAKGAVLTIERTTPAYLDPVIDLH